MTEAENRRWSIFSNLKNIGILILYLSLCLQFTCEKNTTAPLLPSALTLAQVSMPDSIWIGKDSQFRISAYLSDRLTNAGSGGEVEVRLVRENGGSSKTYILYDDGVSGDLIAKDGVYSRYFNSLGFVDEPGIYYSSFYLKNVQAGEGNVTIDTIACFEGSGNSRPEFSNFVIPEYVSIDVPRRMFLMTVDVKDPDGQEDIESVTGYIFYPNSPAPNLQINLRHLDQINDSTFAPETYL